MPSPLLTLLIATILIVLIILVTWPEWGLVARWRRARRLTKRVLREDALKHIFEAEREGHEVTAKAIAGALQVTVNDAVELLAEMERLGLVEMSERGLRLTPEGRSAALHIIRAHRLWERYLADETGFQEVEWHSQAEHQEHHLAPAQLEALAERLGNPAFDPHGDPIPTAEGDIAKVESIRLSALEENAAGRIVHIEDEPEMVYAQLVAEGLHPGMEVQVIERTPQRIRFWADGDERVLAPILAANVSVTPIPRRAPEIAHGERLSSLEIGELAEVVGISRACRSSERRRLMDLGIVPGTRIEVAFRSPSGDPTAYLVRDALIALRKEQADMISIRRIGET
ncbi:MAG: hypothetical protein GXP42_01715 [Chloroflexi bacterium]|nr:hypothetical protein [Chloroflexota bacterium]